MCKDILVLKANLYQPEIVSVSSRTREEPHLFKPTAPDHGCAVSKMQFLVPFSLLHSLLVKTTSNNQNTGIVLIKL